MKENLDDLRREYKDVSDYSVRVGIVFLTMLSLLVISFTRAWNRVNSDDVSVALCKIQKLNAFTNSASYADESVRCTVQLSYIFGEVDEHNLSRQWPCDDVKDPAEDPACAYFRVLPEPWPMDRAELKRACDCQRKLEAELETKAQGWFSADAPIPGVNTTIDLRYWMALFPIGFIVSGLYLFILRKKQLLLRATALKRMKDLEPDQITKLDQMYFESDSAFTAFPSSMTHRLFVLCYLFLPVYLVYATASSASRRGLDVTEGVSFILPLLFYAIAYGAYVGSRFDEQISQINGGKASTNKFRTVVTNTRVWVEKIAQRVNPRLTLVLGATLILISLLGRVSGYGDFSTKGYQLALQPHRQPSIPGLAIFNSPRTNWVIYVSLLTLSMLVICFALFPQLHRIMKQKRARKLLLLLAGAGFIINLVVFSVIEIDRVIDLEYPYYVVFQCLLLVLTLGVWFWVVRSLNQEASLREKRIWAGLVVAYLPFIVFALVWVFRPPSSFALSPTRPAYGLVALYLGTLVMFLGAIHFEYRRRTSSE